MDRSQKPNMHRQDLKNKGQHLKSRVLRTLEIALEKIDAHPLTHRLTSLYTSLTLHLPFQSPSHHRTRRERLALSKYRSRYHANNSSHPPNGMFKGPADLDFHRPSSFTGILSDPPAIYADAEEEGGGVDSFMGREHHGGTRAAQRAAREARRPFWEEKGDGVHHGGTRAAQAAARNGDYRLG